MRKTEEELMSNLTGLNHNELRTLNRFYLHPKNKRCCSNCHKIYDNYREHFHVKKHYPDGSIGYNTACATCKNKDFAKLRSKKRQSPEEMIKARVVHIRHRASYTNLPFNLTSEYLIDLWNRQEGKCFYTGEELSFEHVTNSGATAHKLAPSVDKLVPKLGYVTGNVVWCLHTVNTMKNDFDMDMFLDICERIVEIHRGNTK